MEPSLETELVRLLKVVIISLIVYIPSVKQIVRTELVATDPEHRA